MKRRVVKKRFRRRARTWRNFARRWAACGDVARANTCHAIAEHYTKADADYRTSLRMIGELKRRCVELTAAKKEGR